MPPKRKQADDSAAEPATSTRSTRASTRTGTANKNATTAAAAGTKKSTAKGGSKAATSAIGDGDDLDEVESAPSAKKARTSGPAAQRKTTKAPAKRKGGQVDDDTVAPRKVPSNQKLPLEVSKPSPVPVAEAAPQALPKPAAAPKKAGKIEPYTPARALELFATYAEADDADVIGPEGFEKLCADAEISMEGTLPLILAWQLGSKEMGKITKAEWVQGTSTLKIASVYPLAMAMSELEALLFKNTPSAKASGKEYDRTSYNGYASNPKAAFQKLYMFSFNLVKPEQSKNIDMETSVAFWTVLLVPKYPIMEEIVEFINTTNEKKSTYKATNKDLWSMMLEFCETVKPSLQDYEADGAWPTLLDDFVAWKTSQKGNGNSMEIEG